MHSNTITKLPNDFDNLEEISIWDGIVKFAKGIDQVKIFPVEDTKTAFAKSVKNYRTMS